MEPDDRPQWEIDLCAAEGVSDLDELDEIQEADEAFWKNGIKDEFRILDQVALVQEIKADPHLFDRCESCGQVKPIKSKRMCSACARADQRRRAKQK